MKTNLIKVAKTQLQEDQGNDVLVCNGKLVIVHTEQAPCIVGELIYCVGTSPVVYSIMTEIMARDRFDTLKYWKTARPIIISQTEIVNENTKTANEGLDGDWYYNTIYKSIARTGNITAHDFKILALPENFSESHLKSIINGYLKDGDKILIECGYKSEGALSGVSTGYYIRTNEQNHIKLHNIKEEGWDFILKQIADRIKNNVIIKEHKNEEPTLDITECMKIIKSDLEKYNSPTKK